MTRATALVLFALAPGCVAPSTSPPPASSGCGGSVLTFTTSPGDLAAHHLSMNGSSLSDCRHCHAVGAGSGFPVDNGLCNTCHADIGKDMATRHGLHGQSIVTRRTCGECHTDHQCSSFDMISGLNPKAMIAGQQTQASAWGVAMQQANGSAGTFNHALTGYPLPIGSPATCSSCHPPTWHRPNSNVITYRGLKQPSASPVATATP